MHIHWLVNASTVWFATWMSGTMPTASSRVLSTFPLLSASTSGSAAAEIALNYLYVYTAGRALIANRGR